MANLDHILQGFNAYVDGRSKLGFVEKLETPKIKKKTEKFRSGGMLAEKNHVMGYEVFPWKLSFNAFDPDVIRQAGLFAKNAVNLSFTAAFDGELNAQHTAHFLCRGKFTDLSGGTWEAGKKAMLDVEGSLDALKLTYDGKVVYDIDIDNDVYVVDGIDEYAWIRAAL